VSIFRLSIVYNFHVVNFKTIWESLHIIFGFPSGKHNVDLGEFSSYKNWKSLGTTARRYENPMILLCHIQLTIKVTNSGIRL